MCVKIVIIWFWMWDEGKTFKTYETLYIYGFILFKYFPWEFEICKNLKAVEYFLCARCSAAAAVSLWTQSSSYGVHIRWEWYLPGTAAVPESILQALWGQSALTVRAIQVRATGMTIGCSGVLSHSVLALRESCPTEEESTWWKPSRAGAALGSALCLLLVPWSSWLF